LCIEIDSEHGSLTTSLRGHTLKRMGPGGRIFHLTRNLVGLDLNWTKGELDTSNCLGRQVALAPPLSTPTTLRQASTSSQSSHFVHVRVDRGAASATLRGRVVEEGCRQQRRGRRSWTQEHLHYVELDASSSFRSRASRVRVL
jgi:hypothetical protein